MYKQPWRSTDCIIKALVPVALVPPERSSIWMPNNEATRSATIWNGPQNHIVSPKTYGTVTVFWEFMGVHGCEGYGFRMGKKWKWPKTYQKLDLWSHYRYQSHCFVDPLLFQWKPVALHSCQEAQWLLEGSQWLGRTLKNPSPNSPETKPPGQLGWVDQNIGRKEKQHENQLQHESYGKCSPSKIESPKISCIKLYCKNNLQGDIGL